MAKRKKGTLFEGIGQAFKPVTSRLRRLVSRGQPAFGFALMPQPEPVARPKPIRRRKRRR